MTGPPITFREFDPTRPGESGLVMEPWLNAWRTTPPWRRSSHHEVWTAAWEPRIEAILDQADTRLLMAVADNNPDRIYGWICYDPPDAHDLGAMAGPVVHFVYVKRPFRRFGIASALAFQAAGLGTPVTITYCNGDQLPPPPRPLFPLIATHWTRLCEDFAPGALHYCPSLFKIRRNAKRRTRRSSQ